MPKSRIIAGVALLLVAVAIAFYPALTGQAGFVCDDDVHVTKNASLHSMKGLMQIWTWGPKYLFDATTTVATPQYYPVTFTSFWIESQWWGTSNAWGFHVTNVLLHAGSAILLWAILYRLRLGEGVAFAAALLFAVHPVTVESVVWVSERKNCLALFFMLAAALSYIRWARLDEDVPTDRARRPLFYGFFVAFFVLALLSKTVTSMLLPGLVILTWYRVGRVRKADLLGLAPVFVVALGMGLLTSHIERNVVGAVGPDWRISFVQSFLIASQAIAFYLGKLFVPLQLTFIYPRWEIEPANGMLWIAPAVILAGLAGLALGVRRIGRGPLAAALLFIVMLFPALSFFVFYPMRYSFVADHFQYFACIAVLVTAAAVTGWVVRKVSGGNVKIARVAGAFVLLPVAATFCFLSFQQGRAYKDGDTLWRDTIAKNDRCWMAYENLAVSLRQSKSAESMKEAEGLYRKVLEIRPNHAQAMHALATLQIDMGQFEEAEKLLEQALTLVELVQEEFPEAREPKNLEAFIRNSMASLLLSRNEPEKARVMLEEVVGKNPNYGAAWVTLGNALQAIGRPGPAMDAYQNAINLEPKNAAAYNNLGAVLLSQGKYGEALRRFKQALTHDEKLADAWNNLGKVYRVTQQNLNAIDAFHRAIYFNSKNPLFYYNLSQALMAQHKEADAANALGSALLLNPKFAEAAALLAEVRSTAVEEGVRNPQQAIELAQIAVDLTEEKEITYLEILAQAYAEAKQYENAVEVMQKAVYKAGEQKYPVEQIKAMELRFRKYSNLRATSVERSTQETPVVPE